MISVRSRRAIAALTVVAAVTLPVVVSAIPAAADTPGGFGLIPTPGPAGNARSYFQLTIQPGRSTTDIAIIADLGSQSERLRLLAVPGETAGNSGSAYESALPGPPYRSGRLCRARRGDGRTARVGAGATHVEPATG